MKNVLITVVAILLLILLGIFLYGAINQNQVPASTIYDTTAVPEKMESDATSLDVELDDSQVAFDDMAGSVKPAYKEDPEFRQCANEVVQACLSNAVNKKVLASGDISFCEDMLTSEAQEACRISLSYRLASTNMDTTFCEGLPAKQKVSCLQEVATVKAISGRDLGACDVLVETRDACIQVAAMRLAIDTANPQWCESVQAEQREVCAQEVELLQEVFEGGQQSGGEFGGRDAQLIPLN